MTRNLQDRLNDVLPLAVGFAGICYRNVPPFYATPQDVISPVGSVQTGGRYNFKGTFPVLYLSCDPHTCVEETLHSAQNTDIEIAARLPRTIVAIEVRLNRVLDLTDATLRRRLNVTWRELVAPDWEILQNLHGQEAFTQRLGRLAREVGFQALLVPSAAQRGGKNLIVFVDNVPAGALRPLNLP